MACLDDNTLMQYLEGMLDAQRTRAVEDHLAGCAECRWLLSLGVGDDGSDSASLAPTRLVARSSSSAASEPPSRVGTLLQETYLVERFIGRGGMGTVYEASHRRLHRRFAIKFLTEAGAADKQAVKRLRQEAEVTSRLAHPNIVEVTDFNYAADGAPFIVMELLEGEPLKERLRSGAVADMSEVAVIVSQTASALQAAHVEGIVHRDLKPTNIFLTRDAAGRLQVKVMDFGISKVLGVQTSLTGDIAVMGSPRYMAPEQARGRSSEVDQRADIFALGVIIFEMLCGTPPFVGASVPETLYKVVYDPPSETPVWRAVAAPLRQVVLQALDKQPERRPASMASLWQAFAAALAEAGTTVAPSDGSATEISATAMVGALPAPRFSRRSKLAALVAGIVGVTSATLLGICHLQMADDSPEPRQPSGPPVGGRAATPPPREAGTAPGSQPDSSNNDDRVDSRPDTKRWTKRKPRRRYGRLTIQSKDAEDGQYVWANVYIDGKRRGRTALTIDRIVAGLHRIEVRRVGYRSEKRRVRVWSNRSTRVRFKLKRRR